MNARTALGIFISLLAIPTITNGQTYPFIKDPLKPWIDLKVNDIQNWQGLKRSGDAVAWKVPGKIIYTYPDSGEDTYPSIGLLSKGKKGTLDARYWYGIRFELFLDQEAPFIIKFGAHIPYQGLLLQLPDSAFDDVLLQGKGWHTVSIPFSMLNYNRGQLSFLQNIKQFSFTGKFEGENKSSDVLLRNAKIIRGNAIHLSSTIRSLPAEGDSTVSYTIHVTNCLETPQTITLALQKTGWEGMPVTVTPGLMQLDAGESKAITVRVTVPATVPQGAQETQLLVATSTAASAETMELITSRRLNGPYLVHQDDGWRRIADNVKKYDWAKDALKDILVIADAWVVPVVPKGGVSSDQGSNGVFKSYMERDIWPTAIAWKLTGEQKYGDKIVLFLRRFADPVNGYPSTLHATSQGQPQEGSFVEAVARSYDLVRNSNLLNKTDKNNIDKALRLYIGVVEQMMANGGISNWTVFNQGPAGQCALAIQDFVGFNYLINGPCGVVDEMRNGIMDDGWWYEMSLSYNLGCAEVLTSLALAAKPFGIDLLNAQYPVSLTDIVGLRNFERGNQQGMAFTKYGPVTHNFVNIKKMWDGISRYPDYRGVMFGMGDGHEELVSGNNFELAYYAYRDPAYAAIIKLGAKRNLLYAVPDLPENTPDLYTQSTYSSNAGIAVLRSQADGRPQSEQIQAAVKYGTHGAYHGHFDRVSFLSLMRYGQSFYNPETSWYGYASYMYKWWVQPSLSHNMVVVDGKMQEPKECRQLLFHPGKMMQVIGVETNTRWSNPPYMGGYDQVQRLRSGDAPYVPLPAHIPDFFKVTDFTEPILQRRLIIVTDDYVILADYLKAADNHTFDNLLQLRGAQVPANLNPLAHAAQFDTNPLSSGQFITNVNEYWLEKTTKISSLMRFAEKGADGKNSDHNNWETGGGNRGFNEPGILNIDAWNLWPKKITLQIADYPEAWPVNKKLAYTIKGDGNTLTTDTIGTWILGKGFVNVDVNGIKELKLITRTNRSTNTLKTLFWANAKIITANGREIPLSQLKLINSNIIPVPAAGHDYAGGPVRIAGDSYTDVLPAEPENINNDAVISLDLSGLGAVRLKSYVGGDWPVGNEEQLRKVVDFRVKGNEAQFLTLLEPYSKKSMVKSAAATGANEIDVQLADGRMQHLTIKDMDDAAGNDVEVTITESKAGKILRTETTINKIN